MKLLFLIWLVHAIFSYTYVRYHHSVVWKNIIWNIKINSYDDLFVSLHALIESQRNSITSITIIQIQSQRLHGTHSPSSDPHGDCRRRYLKLWLLPWRWWRRNASSHSSTIERIWDIQSSCKWKKSSVADDEWLNKVEYFKIHLTFNLVE